MSHIIRRARQRIREERRREVEVRVTREGKPVENAQVSLMMRQHEFLFGCNCFPATTYQTKEENDRYTELFTNLLNYGCLLYTSIGKGYPFRKIPVLIRAEWGFCLYPHRLSPVGADPWEVSQTLCNDERKCKSCRTSRKQS